MFYFHFYSICNSKYVSMIFPIETFLHEFWFIFSRLILVVNLGGNVQY